MGFDETPTPVKLCWASAPAADAISAASAIPKRFIDLSPRHVGRKMAPQGSGCLGRNQLKQTRLKTNRNEGVACGYRDEG
ncbi:hypothetical protein [Brevundimonas sp. TWP1-2-1b1]|uniref:hypothetical protein n=1 Tax=unclassified Brevundimonas TaxID=2622653 RepID=UPI003CF2DC74